MSALLDLAAKVEALTGPCGETDVEIAVALGWTIGNRIYVKAPDGTARGILPNWTASLDAAMTLALPGFWHRGGQCAVSSEMRVCPDHNDPVHRERLLLELPPTIDIWDEGIEVELRPGGMQQLILATVSVWLRARAALPTTKLCTDSSAHGDAS